MNSSLSKTLLTILDDRKRTEWALGLGIPKATNSNMFNKGIYPSDKHLRRIMLAENASMSALWGASSAPFMIHRTSSAHETYATLEAHLDDHNWDIHVITGDEFPVFVLSTLAMQEIDNQEFKYTHIEVICGPVDHTVANLFRNKSVKHKQLPENEAHLLATGYKGTYFLFGKETLLDAKEIDQVEVNRICREPSERNAALLKRVMEILDETVIQEGIEVNAQERRKLVSELYTYAIEEGLLSEDVSPNLAHSMLRVI